MRNHENEKDPVRSNKHRAVQVTDESLWLKPCEISLWQHAAAKKPLKKMWEAKKSSEIIQILINNA